DYAGASLDRKSTIGGCQFLWSRWISWQCKKQTVVANSTTEAEYVAASNCCGWVLWIQNQMLDYGYNFMNTKIFIDNESTICIVKNPVFHSMTKHIEIIHHFIRDSYEKRLIQVIKIHTNHNVADLLTKAFDIDEWSGMDWKFYLDEIRVYTGYEKLSDKLTFIKPFFSPQWKYLIHTILQCLSSKSTAWNEFGTNIASAVICLAKNQKFNFSKLISDAVFNDEYDTPSHTKKVFANMRRKRKDFLGTVTPLFPSMLASQAVEGKGSGQPTKPQHTPTTASLSHVELIPTVASLSHPKKTHGIWYQQKGHNQRQNEQNRESEWKERKNSKPKACTFLMGQPCMSSRSTSSNLFSSLRDPESLIRRRNLSELSSLFDFEEVMSIPQNNQGPPPAGPPLANNNGPPPVVRPNGPAPRSMEELCQPSINGRGGPIALIPIQATDFGLRHHMIQQVQNTCQFHGLPGDDANRHIDKFLEITQHMKQNGVSDDALRLSLFPYSLTHHAIAWYDRLPRNSIHSFDDMMRKFLSKYFPPSMVTKLRNEITKFEQKPHESLFEAWERYKLSIDRCPNHNMLLVTQIDTFYNGLTLSHRDTINAAAGGTFMQKTPEECYELIENMTAHHNHWDTSATRDETSRNISSTTTTESPEVVRQLEMMNKNFLDMMRQIQSVKSVSPKCETCGGPHSFTECPAVDGYTQEAAYATTGSLPSNTVANPRGDVKAITTRSGVAYDGPTIPPTPSPLPKEVEHETEATNDKPNPKPSIPYPSRLIDQNLREKANNQMLKFLQIFQKLHFDISFADALLHMSKFASTFKSLLSNKEELLELANTLLNENCSAVLLKKLPEKLGDPEALAPGTYSYSHDTRTRRPIGAHSIGVAEDVFVKVGTFYFLAEFVVVDYDVDPRVPLILERPFLRTKRALIDVHDVACEEYAQEVLGFSDSSTSGNPTPSNLIIAYSSPSFTPFEGGDFILEEIETFLRTPKELSNLDDDYYDTEGDILYLEKLLNEDPSSNLPTMKNDDLKQVDVTMTKPSIEEPPELELKDLPSHLEYAFLERTDKLPVIISKELKDEEKAALLKVLKSHKWAIAWKISDIKSIDPRFCTHKILMEDDFKPAVQHQRRVNPKIHEVIKKEVIKLLDARLIYLISDSPWVSHVHCVPKNGGMTVIENKNIKLIPTRMFAIEETIEVFMDDFLVFGDSFSSCLSYLDKMLKRYEDTNVVLNWEKCHFMVKEGIVLGHKISKSEIEVDRAKVDMLSQDCSGGFSYSKNLMSFRDKKGAENLAADHLSRLENPHQGDLEKKEINETFPFEILGMISFHGDSSTSWFANIANYHAGNFIVKGMSSQQKKKLFKDKEKMKNIYDSKIKNRVFNVGDRVLLFNSRLKIFSGKLKTRWALPFIVAQVFPYGTVELSQTDRPNFKIALDYEDSRACGFIHRSLDLQSLHAYIWESDILDLID
ncbi:reverse transcriptase domain-containing protein, partial [Tanacetum coccineum]